MYIFCTEVTQRHRQKFQKRVSPYLYSELLWHSWDPAKCNHSNRKVRSTTTRTFSKLMSTSVEFSVAIQGVSRNPKTYLPPPLSCALQQAGGKSVRGGSSAENSYHWLTDKTSLLVSTSGHWSWLVSVLVHPSLEWTVQLPFMSCQFSAALP